MWPGIFCVVCKPKHIAGVLGEYASERAMDIRRDYGYHLVVVPVVENGTVAAAV